MILDDPDIALIIGTLVFVVAIIYVISAFILKEED